MALGTEVTRTPHFEGLARAGMAVRGLIYGVIAVLAIKLALGDGGRATNQQGAMQTIARQSDFGKVLLVLVAIGLAGYALWRLSRGILASRGDDAKARVEAIASGIVHIGLCVAAVKVLTGSAGSSRGTANRAAGGVLAWPGGVWIVGIAGVVFAAIGLYQGYVAVKRKYGDEVRTERMGRGERRVFDAVGRFGHLSRMVIFVLVGVFLVRAAADYNAKEAVALDGALAKIAHASYGPALLAAVAVGLFGFALYALMEARYREV